MERLRSRVCDVSVSIVGESVPDMASAIGLFSILPPDLIDGIVKNLPTKDIVKLSLTCKGFVAICIQDSLWQRKWLSGYFREATFKVTLPAKTKFHSLVRRKHILGEVILIRVD